MLDGITRAARVACISAATHKRSAGDRPRRKANASTWSTSVFIPSCSTAARHRSADAEALRLHWATDSPDILHVGSTIPRKRIEFLLQVMHDLRVRVPGVRLGLDCRWSTDRCTESPRRSGCRLSDAIVWEFPYLDRPLLAAVLQESLRGWSLVMGWPEGFGLPVVEARWPRRLPWWRAPFLRFEDRRMCRELLPSWGFSTNGGGAP